MSSAIETFGVTYLDIQSALQGFALDDVAVEVLELIKDEAAILAVHLEQQGLREYVDTDDTRGYRLCRRYLVLRVSAEIARTYTHQDPELSQMRDARAREILDLLRQMPESVPETFDQDEHRGSTRMQKISTLTAEQKRRFSRGSKYFG